ncbi:mucin-5B [Streptomyces niveus]|uniref:mucin-5B n=1 Tax=Streptomyces niveus TaxID=193462 RepID=UPI00344B8B77
MSRTPSNPPPGDGTGRTRSLPRTKRAYALTALLCGALVVPLSLGSANAAPDDGTGAATAAGKPAKPPKPPKAPKWKLLHQESFKKKLDPKRASWTRETYSEPFDTIMEDNGKWYANDYGPAWNTAFNSFDTYRKEFTVGDGGWLTASLSARDWNKDGRIEKEPSITNSTAGGQTVAELNVPDHTGGAIFRPTESLPDQYRIEYKLKTLDFGGKRNGTIDYDNRTNGYSKDGCKTQHPWGEGSNSPGWEGDASAPYCEWQDVRAGKYGYNGFHFLSIVDFADPAPRNNHFWHYRRKVLMDSFSQHPDRVGTGTGGRVCNSADDTYYDYKDSSFNTVNMWISGLPNWTPGKGGLAGNSQWFMTSCSDGVAEQQLSSAAELQPELMPNQDYTFAIERDATGYTLEASGNFARAGHQTLRFHRPFIVDDKPIWHYNVKPGEYDGRYNNSLVQNDYNGSATWPDQWPSGSAYPDSFVIGDLYTNVYEGSASLTDIKMFVPKGKK